MNKRLKKFVDDYGLVNNQTSNFGRINGYEVCCDVNIYNNPSVQTLIAGFVGPFENEMRQFLIEKKKELKILNYQVSNYGIILITNGLTMNKGIDILENAILVITEKLNMLGVKGADYCPFCGEELVDKLTLEFGVFKISVDEKCAQSIHNDVVKDEESFDSAPNNYAKGVLGCIIGTLIGCLIWFGVYMLGFVSALVAIVMVLLGSFGYDLMKGKKDNTKIVTVSISTFLGIFVTMLVIYVVSVSAQMEELGMTGNPLTVFINELVTNNEYLTAVLVDFVQALLFGGLGVFLAVFMIKRKQKRPSENIKIHK